MELQLFMFLLCDFLGKFLNLWSLSFLQREGVPHMPQVREEVWMSSRRCLILSLFLMHPPVSGPTDFNLIPPPPSWTTSRSHVP